MRRMPRIASVWIAFSLLATAVVPALAQAPRNSPGAPMQRMGPSAGPAGGMGTPGAPMPRMGRGGSAMQAPAAPSRGNYGGYGGVMSSQQFRSQNMASQARGAGMIRSSSGIVGGATQGRSSRP